MGRAVESGGARRLSDQTPRGDASQRLDAWLPSDLLARAERLCAPDETLAEFILTAVEQEVRRRQGMRTYAAMLQLRTRDAARPPTRRQP